MNQATKKAAACRAEAGLVRIGLHSTLASGLVHDLLEDARKRPGVSLGLVEADLTELIIRNRNRSWAFPSWPDGMGSTTSVFSSSGRSGHSFAFWSKARCRYSRKSTGPNYDRMGAQSTAVTPELSARFKLLRGKDSAKCLRPIARSSFPNIIIPRDSHPTGYSRDAGPLHGVIAERAAPSCSSSGR